MKKNLILGFQIVLILGFIFIIYTYQKYQNWANKKLDTEIPSYVIENDLLSRKKVDLTDIYMKLNFEHLQNNFGADFKNIYYGEEKINDKFINYIGILEVLGNDIKYSCSLNKEVNASKVDNMVKKVFGDITYKKMSFDLSNKEMVVKYDEATNNYIIKTTKCGGYDFTKGGIKNKYLSAYYENGIAIIEEKVYYLRTLIDTNGLSYKYYLGVSDKTDYYVNSIDKIDQSKLPKYKLVFEKEDKNYYFRYVEKVG